MRLFSEFFTLRWAKGQLADLQHVIVNFLLFVFFLFLALFSFFLGFLFFFFVFFEHLHWPHVETHYSEQLRTLLELYAMPRTTTRRCWKGPCVSQKAQGLDIMGRTEVTVFLLALAILPFLQNMLLNKALDTIYTCVYTWSFAKTLAITNMSPFQKKDSSRDYSLLPKVLRKGNPFHRPFAQLSVLYRIRPSKTKYLPPMPCRIRRVSCWSGGATSIFIKMMWLGDQHLWFYSDPLPRFQKVKKKSNSNTPLPQRHPTLHNPI